jgi:RNA polymerase sigma factor (sigma-70 family)
VTETLLDIPTPALAEPRTRVSATLTDDAQLIAACRRGEARAMEMLYHQFKRRVFGMAHRIVGPNDAEEVAQEVFVRVFRGLAAFRGDSALSTWIYRLTVNASLSHLARRGRRQEVGDDTLADVPILRLLRGSSARSSSSRPAIARSSFSTTSRACRTKSAQRSSSVASAPVNHSSTRRVRACASCSVRSELTARELRRCTPAADVVSRRRARG